MTARAAGLSASRLCGVSVAPERSTVSSQLEVGRHAQFT